jgi:hypothetical protein
VGGRTYAQGVFAALGGAGAFTRPTDVAEVVWRAATDESDLLHFPAGVDAVALAGSTPQPQAQVAA